MSEAVTSGAPPILHELLDRAYAIGGTPTSNGYRIGRELKMGERYFATMDTGPRTLHVYTPQLSQWIDDPGWEAYWVRSETETTIEHVSMEGEAA